MFSANLEVWWASYHIIFNGLSQVCYFPWNQLALWYQTNANICWLYILNITSKTYSDYSFDFIIWNSITSIYKDRFLLVSDKLINSKAVLMTQLYPINSYMRRAGCKGVVKIYATLFRMPSCLRKLLIYLKKWPYFWSLALTLGEGICDTLCFSLLIYLTFLPGYFEIFSFWRMFIGTSKINLIFHIWPLSVTLTIVFCSDGEH